MSVFLSHLGLSNTTWPFEENVTMGISDATTVYADDVISTDTVAAQGVKYIVDECPEEGCIYGLMNDMQVHYSSLRKPVIFFD